MSAPEKARGVEPFHIGKESGFQALMIARGAVPQDEMWLFKKPRAKDYSETR